MKRIITLTLALIMLALTLCSCNLVNPEQEAEISRLEASIADYQDLLRNRTPETVIVREEKVIEVGRTVEVTVPVPVEGTTPVEITVPVPVTEATKPIETIPVNTPNETSVKSNGVTIIYPTKATLNYICIGIFNDTKTRYSTCEISDIKVEYSHSSFLSSLKISFTAKKTYDKHGNNNIDSCYFRYRLKDETTGLIVADSLCFTTNIAVGEATKEEESIFEDLITGHTYRIVFYDYEI